MVRSISASIVILISVTLALILIPYCHGKPSYYQNEQISSRELKFPVDSDSDYAFPANNAPIPLPASPAPLPVAPLPFESAPDVSGSDDLDHNELLKDLPPNVDLNNLTPEQKEVFEELLSLADSEDSQVQGRTFGLVKHKFSYLWNKFISLLSPHKFFEFEHIPHGYNQVGGDYPYNKRVQEPVYTTPIKFPSLLGGITRFFGNFGQPIHYAGPPGYYYEDPAKTGEQIFE